MPSKRWEIAWTPSSEISGWMTNVNSYSRKIPPGRRLAPGPRAARAEERAIRCGPLGGPSGSRARAGAQPWRSRVGVEARELVQGLIRGPELLVHLLAGHGVTGRGAGVADAVPDAPEVGRGHVAVPPGLELRDIRVGRLAHTVETRERCVALALLERGGLGRRLARHRFDLVERLGEPLGQREHLLRVPLGRGTPRGCRDGDQRECGGGQPHRTASGRDHRVYLRLAPTNPRRPRAPHARADRRSAPGGT